MTHLAVNDFAVNLAGGDVIVARKCHIQISFVVAKVEIDLSTVIECVDFA